MTTIKLNSQIYRDILIRSKTINNIIDDLNDFNDDVVDEIFLVKDFNSELEYLEEEMIYNIDLSKRDDYLKILIDRLGFFVYLDMDEEIDIKPLANFIGKSIEPELYKYVGDLIDFNNEYIGYIDYDILYLIVENYPILHVYKELEDFAITENLYNKIYNNIPRYVSLWYHTHQKDFLKDYNRFISNKYYSIIHEYNIIFYIKSSNEFIIKYFFENEPYIKNKEITYYENIVTNDNNPNLISSDSVSITHDMKYWYKLFYEKYCSFTNLNIMLYVREQCLNYNIDINDNSLLENSVKNSNYPIVRFVLDNLIRDIEPNFLLKLIYLSVIEINKNANQSLKIMKLLVRTFRNYNFKLDDDSNPRFVYSIFKLLKDNIVLFNFLLENLIISKRIIDNIFNICVYYNLIDNLKILLQYGADVNNDYNLKLLIDYFDDDENKIVSERRMAMNFGYTPLCIVAFSKGLNSREINTANFLLLNKANINFGQSPLICACINDNFELVKLYISKGTNVNAVFHNGKTALHYAITNNNFELFKYLIAKGADLNDINNRFLLHLAVRSNNFNVTKYLIESGANVNLVDNNNRSVLFYTTTGHFNEKLISFLLENGANDINAFATIFESSCSNKYDQIEFVKYLIEYDRVNLNIMDRIIHFGLVSASSKGNLNIVKLLLKHGADVNRKNIYRTTALMALSDTSDIKFYTNFENYLEIANLLLEYANISNINESLLIASSNNLLELIQLLLDKGADVNYENVFGDTALITLSNTQFSNNIVNTAELLLKHGANINHKNKNGDNVLLNFLRLSFDSNSKLDFVNFLLEKGINPNCENDKNYTPLILSIYKDEGELLIKTLLNYGANINYQNEYGNTVLMHLLAENRYDFADIDDLSDVDFPPVVVKSKFLLDMGADISLKNNKNQNAITIYLNNPHMNWNDLFEYINIDYKDEFNNDILMLSLYYGRSDYVDKLLKIDINLHNRNTDDETALILALDDNQLDVAKQLLKKDPTIIYDKNKNGETIFLMATRYGTLEIIKYLMTIDNDVIHDRDNNGNTPLMNATVNGHLDIVQYLLTINTNIIYDENNDGDTALSLASKNNQLEIFELLSYYNTKN